MTDDKKRDDYTVEMEERNGNNFESPKPLPRPAAPVAAVANNPIFPILSYCGSSILMTVMNKYVLSGLDFNLNFFLLCVQVSGNRLASLIPRTNKCPKSVVCIVAIQACKSLDIITYRDFNTDEARKCNSPAFSLLDIVPADFSLRVSRVPTSGRHDIHRHKSPAIPFHSRIHDLQESHNYHNRIRRGLVVWWLRDWHDADVFWVDGYQLDHCGLGRYSARTPKLRPF